jgi:glucokinase
MTDSDVYAGFDIGGSQLKYGLVDSDNSILQHGNVEIPDSTDGLMRLLRSLWESLSQQEANVQAAGFGFPGIYSQKEQRIKQSPNYPQIEEYDLHAELARIFHVPFWIDNEANLAAYGEFLVGAGQGASSLVLLTIGSGIGTGIILNGGIWRGTCGFAGELGHSPANPAGDICKCGHTGCLETEVSASKIVKTYRTQAQASETLSAEDICLKAQKGDKIALRAFTQAGRFLGVGIATLINLLNPEKILVGGGVMEAGDLILPAAVEEARRRSYGHAFDCCTIAKARLGNQAGFIGAALWARDNLLRHI